MSYQVLARKWRPATFDALVGQEHVLQALRHALDSDRLHHAYLFTGTRGVGKTTIARILARCLNCETGVSATPCGVCSSCVEISEGRSVDLIEVDAASRTKVEDTRELLDNVQYAPTRSRFKVYLIDEVHMLSGHSFNALLKTLEEPPEHVKFLLATTDPQKLPATVLSRCLQFNLKNMSAERVAGHLRYVLEQEAVAFDAGALWALGRAAAGSMRDALSLTDQAIAFGGGALREAEVAAMLGTVDRRHLLQLLEALLDDNAQELLAVCGHMAEQGIDFAAAVQDLCGLFHRVAVEQVVPGVADQEFGDGEAVTQLARRASAEDIQLFYSLAQDGASGVAQAADPQAAFEMLALRLLAFRPVTPLDPHLTPEQLQNPGPGEDPKSLKKPEPPPAATSAEKDSQQSIPPLRPPSLSASKTAQNSIETGASRADASMPIRETVPVPVSKPEAPGETPAPISRAPLEAAGRDESTDVEGLPWHEVLRILNLSGSALNVASHCELVSRSGARWALRLDQDSGNLYNDRHRSLIADALSAWLEESVELTITPGVVSTETPAAWRRREALERQAAAERSIHDDPQVHRLLEEFDAKVLEGSVVVED